MEKNMYKSIKSILMIILVILILYLIFGHHSYIIHINMTSLRNFILSYGKFSELVFVIIYGLKPLVFIVPASLMSILAGSIFGPFKAFALSMIGSFFSATVGFYMTRLVGKSFIDKMLKGKVIKLEDNIEKNGFMIMFMMRISMIFPYDALSYAAGVSKIKYKDFVLATMLGIIPEMISYSLMGKNIKHPFSMKFIAPIVLLVLVVFLGSFMYKNYKKNQ